MRLTDGRVARLETVACCLCGTRDDEPVLVVQDWGYGLTLDPFVIVRCRRCGLAYLNPRPVPEDMGLFYPTIYYERVQVPASEQGPDAVAGSEPRRVSAAALAEQASLCGGAGRGRILDVGCSSGVFLAHMRSLGWDVCGVEISRDAAEWASRELGLHIVNRPLTAAGLPGDHFDVVTFWSSLEHMHDPMDYLQEAFRILKPGGKAIILIPNFSSPTVRWLHWGLDPPRHLYHFTPRTITRALRKAGFSGRIGFRGTSRVEEGSLHRQVAKLGRRLRRSSQSNGGPISRPFGAAAGWAIARSSRLLAPVSWILASARRAGPMTVITHKD